MDKIDRQIGAEFCHVKAMTGDSQCSILWKQFVNYQSVL